MAENGLIVIFDAVNCKQLIMGQKEISNRIEYIVSCVGEFAARHSLTNSQAYHYLKRFLGIEFLVKFYEAEHQLSIEDAVDDMTMICHRSGGAIA